MNVIHPRRDSAVYRLTFAVLFVLILTSSSLIGCSGGNDNPGQVIVPDAPSNGDQDEASLVVSITAPESGTTYSTDDSLQFVGEATDSQDGELSGNSLIWESNRDGEIGRGASVITSDLTSGGHNVKLTATASHGASASDTIFVWITEPPGAEEKRVGETNPYAPVIERLPVQRDDEVITIRHVAVDDSIEFGYIERPVATYESDSPSSDPVSPEITASIRTRTPVAADAGRISGGPVEDMAIVTRSSAGGSSYRLEIYSLFEAGRHLMAEYPFSLPNPDTQVAVHVADLDAFNEITDATSSESRYHDEVILAYPEIVANELRGTVKVLSFETAEFAKFREGPLPTAVSQRTITTTQPMYPSSQLIIESSDERIKESQQPQGPQFVVAYLDSQRQIAIDVFRYDHTRGSSEEPDPATDTRELIHILHQIISDPLSVETANAHGWSLAVERGDRIGSVSQLHDDQFLLPVWHQGGDIWQDAWILDGSDSNDPVSLLGGGQSFSFASLTIGGGVIEFDILPNSTLQMTSARTVNDEDGNTSGDCELIGLVVLADTIRGPIIQTLRATSNGEFPSASFEPVFGPASMPPNWWPGYFDPLNSQETTLLSNTALVAGGLTSYRNGLRNERGNRIATGADFCGGLAPELGPMPSYYIAQPDIGELHAVTEVIGRNRANISTVPLTSDIGDRVLLLTGDADGDAAYYSRLICIDGTDDPFCRRINIGDATLHYVVENYESSNVILQQPPKHIDYLPALGGLTNISMNDGFYAEFAQTDTNSGRIDRKIQTDWTIGANTKVGIGIPGAKNADLFNLSLDAEHQTVSDNFDARTVTVSLQQTTRAIGDDVVWGKTQTIDFWRFPAQGGKTLDNRTDTRFSENAYLEIAIPEKPTTLIGPGTTNDGYQPDHHIGNILSYPAFSGDVTDIGELFGFLGAYVPTDENGDRECKPLDDGDLKGCLRKVNNALTKIATVSAALLQSDDFVGGEFESVVNPVDVAEVLQIGGTSYSAELEFSEEIRRGKTVTNTDKINGEFNGKIPLKVPKIHVPVVVDQQIRSSAAFQNAEISENTLGSTTRIVLNIPGGLPTHRSYQIRPAFGFSVGGSLSLNYQVNTSGLTDSFWFDHYTAPDPALNMPFRIVRGDPNGRLASSEFSLGTDSTRSRIKSFFIRDGSGVDPLNPSATIGDILTKAPLAGEPVQLEVRVWNLSVATPVENLVVEFTAQEYVNGAPIGNPVLIGGTSISYLPFRGQFEEDPVGHVQSAYAYWDTTGYGPPPGSALRSWVINVTLDPADQIPNETHELLDRFNDPLVGPTGDILDPELEKGQNNRGWSVVRIAPALDESQQDAAQEIAFLQDETQGPYVKIVAGPVGESEAMRARLAGFSKDNRITHTEGVVGETVEIMIGLQARSLIRDYGTLRVFDGDPSRKGSRVLLTKLIQGVSGSEATFESIRWRPRSVGNRTLYLSYNGGGTDKELLIPIPVRVK